MIILNNRNPHYLETLDILNAMSLGVDLYLCITDCNFTLDISNFLYLSPFLAGPKEVEDNRAPL